MSEWKEMENTYHLTGRHNTKTGGGGERKGRERNGDPVKHEEKVVEECYRKRADKSNSSIDHVADVNR